MAVATVLMDRAIAVWAMIMMVALLGGLFWSLGMLEGVTRAVAIEAARGDGLMVREEPHGPEALAAADEVFVTSTLREAMPVTALVFLESSGEQRDV